MAIFPGAIFGAGKLEIMPSGARGGNAEKFFRESNFLLGSLFPGLETLTQ